MNKEMFGYLPDGRAVTSYVISSDCLEARILDFGAALQSLTVNGTRDVVLGYRNLEGYLDNPACMGCVIAPNANRIAGAGFKLDGISYQLDVNDRTNNLHSHLEKGAHKRLWEVLESTENSVTMQLKMADGELGFPGNRTIQVIYAVEGDTLSIRYRMISDKKTVWNPTNHSYFNLDGHDSGKITEHRLQLNCHEYNPIRPDIIAIDPVAVNEVFDFTKEAVIGEKMNCDDEQLKLASGFDHNFCIDGYDGSLKFFGTLTGSDGRIKMNCYTTQPGVQVYTGNFLGSDQGKGGAEYGVNDGVAMETQFYPDAVNHPEYPSPFIEAGKWQEYETRYQFEGE